MTIYRSRRVWFATSVLVLVIATMLLSDLTSQVRAASTYIIPDVLGNPPRYAMTLNNGNAVLTYFSKNTNKIVVATCGNAACQTDLTVINPISPDTPQNIAIAMVSGNPFVVYTTTPKTLSIVACVDALCSQPPVINTLNSTGGSFSKIAITLQNGLPIIAYQVDTSGLFTYALKLAFCNDTACTAPTIRTLVTSSVDNNSDIELGLLNGNPIVTYTVATTSNFYLVKCLSATCTETPTVKTIDTTVRLANSTGMTVAQDTPVITYVTYEDSYNSWLNVATCTDAACDGPMYIHKVDRVRSSGDSSVALVDDLPMITYWSSAGVWLATCLDLVCNYSSGTQLADFNFIEAEIRSASNSPIISLLNWSDPNNLRLYIYNTGDFQPQYSPTPTDTPTITFTPISSQPPTPILTATVTLTPSITPTASMTLTPTNTLTPTPVTPTSAPSAAPTINFYTTHTKTLTWNRISWATGYQIQISMDKNFAPAATFTTSVPADTLEYTITDLPNGTYYWRVKAVDSTNNVWSNIGSFVISAPP